MLLAQLVETSRQVTATSKKLEKIDLLARLLGQMRPEEAEIAVAFLSGRTRQGRIGVGYATLRDAAAAHAEAPSIGIEEADAMFQQIAAVQGRGADKQRRDLLASFFQRATEPEQRFLIGLLGGELRQGALEGIVVEALAKAAKLPADRVRRAVMVAGDIAPVARAVMAQGEAGLAQYDVQLFRPVQPMLAGTAEDVPEALGELGEAALEYKLDGARVQVHKSGDQVVVYSRGLNDVTVAAPEIVEMVRSMPARGLILDGEVLSLRPDGAPQPFQITMRRFGRKLDVERMRAELPLSPFFFDLLYIEGAHLLDEPQARRFEALREIADPAIVIPHLRGATEEQAEAFLQESLGRGHEGIMAKSVAAPYAAGSRGQSWLKIKQARTLDLVILAAEWGSGRRQGWLSNLHLGARDVEKGGFAMLGKTFKGLTDEMLGWQTQELLKLEIGRDSNTVFVEPKLVVEIAFNEIQVSPRYESGLALRFARVKSYRTDKPVMESDTFQTVRKMAGLE